MIMKSIRTRLFALLALLFAATQTVSADYQPLSTAPSGNWTDYKAQAYSQGSGTEADPYVIRTAAELACFAANVTGGNTDKSKCFVLGDDINLAEHLWTPIGNLTPGNPASFSGTFDGNGHVIRNMTVAWEAKSNGKKAYGLFSQLLAGAKVRNLIIDNAYLYNTDTGTPNAGEDRLVAVFAGQLKSNVSIENIIVRNSKVEVKNPFSQNGKWIIYGGFAAKVADNNDNYTLSNIYVDADIDFTNMTVTKPSAVYSALFIPEFFGNVKKAPRNLYVEGSITAGTDITLVGPVFGTNLPNSSTYKDTWAINSSNTYRYTTDSGTIYNALTTKNAGGYAVDGFGEDLIGTYNSYIAETDYLLPLVKNADGIVSMQKVSLPKIQITYDTANLNCRIAVTIDDADMLAYSYEWTLDGTKIPDATSSTHTLPLSNTTRKGTVRVYNTADGYDQTLSYTITPPSYSIDIYSDQPFKGSGTTDDPYLISSDLQLAKLARDVSEGNAYNGKCFKLTQDISLDKALWMPIGKWDNYNKYFGGKFDGDGHTISNMHIAWEPKAGAWVYWGLFGYIKGTADRQADYAVITNLIVDGAVVEKKAGCAMSGSGLNIGVVCGEIPAYSELSNIIVRNSQIKDNGETYTLAAALRAGGIAGNIQNTGKSEVRLYNLAADTEISLLNNAATGSCEVGLGGMLGRADYTPNTTAPHITPTNIIIHGNAIDTDKKTNSKFYFGPVVGMFANNNAKINGEVCWYLNSPENATNTSGTQTTAADVKSFQTTANKYLSDNGLSDKYLWAYTYDDKTHKTTFSFGNIELTAATNKTFDITAPEGTYTWYLSSDKKTWKKITDGTDNDVTANTVSVPYQEYIQYVYAKTEQSVSRPITVPALRITAISLSHTDGSSDYSVSVRNSLWDNNLWDNNDNLQITYSWYKNYDSTNGNNTAVGSEATYTYTKAEGDPDNVKISCHVVVKYNGTTIADKWLGGLRIVYLCPDGVTLTDGTKYNAGNDTNDGMTPGNAKKTWQGAYAALHEEGTWDDNIIVLMGTSNSAATMDQTGGNLGFGILGNLTGNGKSGDYETWIDAVKTSKLNRNTTITGKYDEVDYKGVIEMKGGATGQSIGDEGGLGIFGDTRFRNITFQHKKGNYDIIFCQYNSLEMGESIIMSGFPDNSPGYGTLGGATTTSLQIFGGVNNDNRFGSLDTPALIKKMEDSMPHGREGFSITLKSGFYSCICAGGRQTTDGLSGLMGTADMPVKCTITMDIDREWNDAHNQTAHNSTLFSTYDAGIIMAGNHEGAMFGDVDIVIRSGYVGRLVNGTLGAHRDVNTAINAPFNSYMGRASITLDPASSKNNTFTQDINERVVVTELYGGSCGRGFTNYQMIENPFYGHGKVVINGGTIKKLGSSSNEVLCSVYGAGAGGINGIGEGSNITPDKRIGYWETAEGGKIMKFGEYSTAKSKGLLTYSCYNADTHTTTVISPLDTKSEVIINGGQFGTKDAPIDGVYGGGSGYMAHGLWTTATKSVPSQFMGNIYGKAGETVASLTINGGEFWCTNGIFAGGRGTDQYFATNAYGADGASGRPSAKDFTELAKIFGDVELTITGGTFHCPVFGGGYGVADAKCKTDGVIQTLDKMAMLYGKTTVNISGGTFYGNIYGGGDMACIQNADGDATSLNIFDKADIRGSVFAGGNGRKRRAKDDNTISGNTQSPERVGKVYGNVSLSLYGTAEKAPKIYGDIYGGGNLAQIGAYDNAAGDTHVSIYAGNIAGEIFGGGKGMIDGTLLTSADVSGNTNVALAQDNGGQTDDADGQKVDHYSINFIWDTMWDAASGTLKRWDVEKSAFFNNGKFLNPHNIYGGGKDVCTVGTYAADGTLQKGTGKATVEVLKGMTPYKLLTTKEWKDSYTDNKNPHFYVFGGGYGSNTTVGATDVTVNVEGDYGIYDAEVGDEIEQLADARRTKSGTTALTVTGRSAAEVTQPVFDNSKGIPNFTVLGVLGGGYKGIVETDTKVVVDGKTFLHRVYGGGFGDPDVSATANFDASGNSTDVTGLVKGNTEVYVMGANIYGDVFGGGAGVAPKLNAAAYTYYPSTARVNGTTKVEVSGDARIYGTVYGGGDIANVGIWTATKTGGYYATTGDGALTSVTTLNQADGTFVSYEAKNYKTMVNIVGGDIFGEVFGGGRGLLRAEAPKYYQVGRVNGHTLVHVAETQNLVTADIDAAGNSIPHIWNRIYGGCAYGTVDGNTLVHIEGGRLGMNVFGGGYGNIDLYDAQANGTLTTTVEKDILEQVLGTKDTGDKATYANVLGNTKVQIDGGSWIWNRKADINGNIMEWTDANLKVGNSLDDFKNFVAAVKYAKTPADITDPKALDIVNKIITSSSTQEFFSLDNRAFVKNHNIFGGGNRACIVGSYGYGDTADPQFKKAWDTTAPDAGTGKAEVILNHSPLTDITLDDGRSLSMLDCNTLAGVCWYIAVNNISHPQFSVFGAGYGVNTKVGTTEVYAQPGAKIAKDGGEALEISGVKYRYLNQVADLQRYEDFEQAFFDDYASVSPSDKMLYYGSPDGTDADPNTYLRYRASRLAWSLGAPNFVFIEIHGGGFSGYVTGNASVETDCQLSCRNIFGGGLGAKPYLTAQQTYAADATTYDFGRVGGSTRVFIKSGIVSQDVFGGGAGVESVDTDDDGTPDIDFPDMARVAGKTQVHIYGETFAVDEKNIERTLVFGHVYGGGDVANVGTTQVAEKKRYAKDAAYDANEFTTTVNIRGASVLSQIFAGGKGRRKKECTVADNTGTWGYQKLGGVYGNTCFIIDLPTMDYPYCNKNGTAIDPAAAEQMASRADGLTKTPCVPYVWDRIYGGCQNGTVYGNTLVDIREGYIVYNVFGGGWGDTADSIVVAGSRVPDPEKVTLADVKGSTNVMVKGGEVKLTAYWLSDKRSWEPATILPNGTIYSPQYDHSQLKFKINHNIYGGGNAAGVVGGDTYVTLLKGLLKNTTQTVSGQTQDNFFASNEWKEVYQKVGSPHFAVFGGGYGENTVITGDTHVTSDMPESGIATIPELVKGEEYKHCNSEHTVMDLIGGGYNGRVNGETFITANGGLFCRRVFGGGFYNSVSNTNVSINAIDCQDIFGGGLMGDVINSTNISVGSGASGNTNADIFIHGSIYGGNDVSGYVNISKDTEGYFKENNASGGTNISIRGGRIDGNVYGAGNGDYLYALDRQGNEKVTVNEHYPINPDDEYSKKIDLVYTVPMRETMASYLAASDAQKIVNINSWRPLTNRVNISIRGNSASDEVTIKGDVYGGGNSATVLKVNDAGATAATTGNVTFDIGSNVSIGRVFMGCNGDALFLEDEKNPFMSDYQKLNGDVNNPDKEMNLADPIDWENNAANEAISELYLPVAKESRPLVYKHLIDLYFQPVEMNIQPVVKWNGTEDGNGLENCTIGTFCCGGNRGNMNIQPAEEGEKKGNALEYTFPAGLVITDKIVGGCNNANYELKGTGVSHEGGYLLGLAKSVYPFIKLNINNQFEPSEIDGAYVGGNVFGGCFETGTVRGDITINLKSDMLKGKEKAKLNASNEKLASDPQFSALNVFAAGYGMESYVYGNTNVKVAEGVKKPYAVAQQADDNTFGQSAASANFIYGGGQQGNVIGVTNVEVFNGYIYKSVTGGSYSGFVWGSTHVKVGYPEHYTVNYLRSGRYILNRIDQNNKDIDNGKTTASETIKQTVFLVTGDLVSKAVYNDIIGIQNGEAMIPLHDDNGTLKDDSGTEYITLVAADTPAEHGFTSWDDIDIVIGEAVYGGGYSIAQGSSVLANNTTVLKFTDKYNLDIAFQTNDDHKAELASLPGGTTKGFGGNTTILIADRVPAPETTPAAQAEASVADRDHITISRQEMKEATIADEQDLLGYYYKGKDEKFHYIYLAGKYFKGDDSKLPADINETDKRIFEYDNEGGIFGDGHLSYAEGFRSADLTGYGYADHTVKSPKIINTFQRMDILRLTDNCFSLLGARDYATNATDKTPYSISRVNEIQMVSTIDGNKQLVPVAVGTESTDGDLKRARNYMGFANNILYVGALNSDVTFADKWHDGVGKLGAESDMNTDNRFAGKSYQEVKQHYIDYYNNTANSNRERYFQARNNGTAKNMIGIASGYALKIQGVQELKNESGNITEKAYYGPIYGVIEMNLIDVREDEGGGYVYADNIHRRPEAAAAASEAGEASAPAEEAQTTQHEVDFLETTGNFVFPYMPQQSRFIVDDCFPKGYSTLTAGQMPDNAIEAHYWYVTGFNYHYNAHITGYTYDTSKTPKAFFSNNADGIMALSGLKADQVVTIDEWRIHSSHTAGTYTCDLEVRNYADNEKDHSGNLLKKATGNAYTLVVGASESNTYDEAKGFRATLPMNAATATINGDATLDVADAKLSFRLTDQADNTTSEYYNSHLSEPCTATLVLRAPALQYKVVDGGVDYDQTERITGYVALKTVYTKDTEGDTYTPVTSGTLESSTTYYVKYGETNFYQEIDLSKVYTYTEGANPEYVEATTITLGKETTYYALLDRYYTYTIDLIIEYVQGPDIDGHINVENCILPGERIRINKKDVVINADESFPANGYYWRIGKRSEKDGTWDFEDNTAWVTNSTAKGYDVFDQSAGEEGKGLFKDCYYDKTNDVLEIPAYYFMDGYGVQLGVTFNGINENGQPQIFPVKMREEDRLVIHNYHQMHPHKEGVDLHLAEAVARAAKDEAFAEPRVYINDKKDLSAFVNFVDTVGTCGKVRIGTGLLDVPRYGSKAQFVLQNDIEVPADLAGAATFAGIFHGNGHVISGLPKVQALIGQNKGQIYNLGMARGSIAAANVEGGNYHCCFEYETNGGGPYVYRIDGKRTEEYTYDDFRYGKAAYDLNQYYLEARKDLSSTALQYVKDYYANGDYQYACQQDAITENATGITYLRTGQRDATPNYGEAVTRHDKTHAIDRPRAHGYVAATETEAEQRTGDYEPLFNAAGHKGETAVDNDNQMNDYIFWGQSLAALPDSYPATVASHQTSYMSNRVWRAAGYYGDTTVSTFHYNAYNHNGSTVPTYVHIPATTAIDFSCQNDNASLTGVYYPPVADNATAFSSFDTSPAANITRNLLVYTEEGGTNSIDEVVDKNNAFAYDENTRESVIKGHHITVSKAADVTSATTRFLHLVERTADNLNSEGGGCLNNDFCAPVSFSVTERAWYVRKPMAYAEAANTAWEGVCLPFTVHKAEASINGEITHFYGTAAEGTPAAGNTNSLHHEYWLRGLHNVTAADRTEAVFKRPGTSPDLFMYAAAPEYKYVFENTFFVDTYKQYNSGDNDFYTQRHIYDGYIPLTAGVAYIVSFPGKRFYEFDLSSAFYNMRTNSNEAAQTVTFNAYGNNSALTSYGTVTIPVTAQMSTAAGGYSHCGTFAATPVGDGVYGIDAEGKAFSASSDIMTVMPFRTYMTASASAQSQTRAASSSIIYIGETTGIDSITPEGDGQAAEETADGDYVKVWPAGGRRIRVESTIATTLKVFTATGKLYRLLDVRPGTATYSGFQPGLYIAGKAKIRVE